MPANPKFFREGDMSARRSMMPAKESATGRIPKRLNPHQAQKG